MKINATTFSVSNMVMASEWGRYVGKEYLMFIDSETSIPVEIKGSATDTSLSAAFIAKDSSGKEYIAYLFKDDVALKIYNIVNKDELPKSFINHYRSALANIEGQLQLKEIAASLPKEFTPVITVSVNKEWIKSVTPLFKEIESRWNGVKALFGEKSKDVEKTKKQICNSGAIRKGADEKNFTISIDGKFATDAVEFICAYTDEVIRITTGMFALFNLKAMESRFIGLIKKLNDRDQELK